jgi:CubicO group peptidase (beta-lactamase class C family)
MNYKSLKFATFFLFIFSLLFTNAFSQGRFDEVSKLLKSKRSVLGGNVCMLVSKNNEIVFEQNLGDFNKNSQARIASCSKWLTAALIATFIDEGRLSPDDSLGKFLPVFSSYGKGSITIGQCMSHTTGIESTEITIRALLERRKFKSLDEELNSFVVKPISGQPGKTFAYSNIGLNIVGRILELISHNDFETLFQERIAKPLGMKNTSFSADKVVNPSGGAVSTPMDYLIFLNMLLDKGKFKGKQVLSAEVISQMQRIRTENVKVLYRPAEAKYLDYGWGEWVLERNSNGEGTVLSSPGLFGTFPWIDIQRNYAAIIFVKNIHFKDRQKNAEEVRVAVNKVIK